MTRPTMRGKLAATAASFLLLVVPAGCGSDEGDQAPGGGTMTEETTTSEETTETHTTETKTTETETTETETSETGTTETETTEEGH